MRSFLRSEGRDCFAKALHAWRAELRGARPAAVAPRGRVGSESCSVATNVCAKSSD